MELLRNTNIDFMGLRKISFIISGIVAIVGILGVIAIGRGTANMGIDFSGGIAMQVKFNQPVTTQGVRDALSKGGIHEVELQEITGGNQILVKMHKSEKSAQNVEDALKQNLAGNAFTVESSTEIGPSIGEKLKKDTLIAVALSMLGIILYIAWRFDFKFGVGAVVATMHDVLAMIAVFYVLHKEVNILLITAVLTIAGYSLTDTVVVFDRIRENMHKSLKDPMFVIFNRSINETLSRTIITSVTTFLSAVSLYLFGGEVINDFAFALVIGVLVATYSSIFVASPIVALWEKSSETPEAKAA
ncbi:protein export membrane protein SecF [Citrifermentans bemidjiense Bem]|uniref:Protein-export membrane protein SecF n=1 Tax=Citrifermentans bemidjiense (strain ATCC BAA-1014 / DSM 16622 / JCM 12645 / Bem) TaxID=404380 RepID=B5EFX5_CITBB|nr:protein translocase subunit SecF [Citrifermentans bemidjiense]ACH39440.1 protein export membrane protein SecF [Citrifermentans bemidjiense Bem]